MELDVLVLPRRGIGSGFLTLLLTLQPIGFPLGDLERNNLVRFRQLTDDVGSFGGFISSYSSGFVARFFRYFLVLTPQNPSKWSI